MSLTQWLRSRTRRLSLLDLALVKLCCIAVGVLLAQLVPAARRLDPRLVAAVAAGLAVKPAVSVLAEERPAPAS